MSSTPADLRQLVIERAQGKCEYCLIHQDFSIYSHEVDHIIAVKHDGKTVSENLALACLSCNRYKGGVGFTGFCLTRTQVNLKNLTLSGKNPLNGTGNTLNNLITGNKGK